MRGIRSPRHPRWLTPAALAVVSLVTVGLSTAAPVAAAPAAGAPVAAAAHPALSKPRTASCVKATNGRPAHCRAPLRIAQLPQGARNQSTVSAPVKNPAAMVDTRTWTTGGGNTFPGADVPFGMVQWSPDTMPNNNAGGGYSYGDEQLWGYSLTHISGPGCGAAGDVPILPMTGGLPSGDPGQYTTSFSNTGEIAQAGYYSAQSNQPDTITSLFTATPHSAMGQFTFPRTTQADFLIKLLGSQNGDGASSATIVGNNQVSGSATSGNFCGETNNDGQVQQYTVHFDLVFSQPFTASQVITQPGQSNPDAVFLTFDTTSNPVVSAKVAISYVSAANAHLDMQTENAGWDFSKIQSAAQQSWNNLLGRISVSGGSYAQTQEFYSLLYKDFMQPNITSDVNGQYMGSDMKIHTLASGQHNQYGIFSGWDTYHSLSQLQAMLDPSAAGDMAQSLLNYYAQNGILQQWGYLNLDNYVMVGDPSDSIIADMYAFGARNFDTHQALTDMLKQATTVNDVRPGEALEAKYGYLPEDGSYGCCNSHGYVPTLLEYDSQDFALAQFAKAMGDTSDAAMLENLASNWVNVFDSSTGLLTPRLENGSFLTGITATTSSHYVEGDAYEYLWNVPNDYAGLFSLLGGNTKVAPELRQYLSQPNGYGMHAQLTNEFDLGEQNAPDYAGDPAGTQQAVNNIRNSMYLPGPSGLANNDDLGANSSTFIWEMLGMYPENSGSDTLVFSSPGFPHEVITLPTGKRITITAPGASPTQFYVNSLSINGAPYSKLYVPFSTLAQGSTLNWSLGTSPTSWGSAPQDAPPSSGPVFADSASVSPDTLYLQPGAAGNATVSVQSLTSSPQTVTWTASPSGGVTVTPSNGSLTVGPDGTGSIKVAVNAGATDGSYPVTFNFKSAAGTIMPVQLAVIVAKPGDLGPYYNDTGISNDGAGSSANYDGDGFSYSEQALTAAGLSPGASVSSGGLTYTWPSVPAGQPDSVMAAGQTIPVSTPSGASSLGFLGSSINAGTSGASGTVTINYTDGSTSTAALGVTDWTLGGGSGSPQFGNATVATTPYRNAADGTQQSINTYVFAAKVPIDSSKTVASITLPATVANGSIGIFSISAG
ncbi:MAG TPA: GH92 family glycosyl hydrolase [Streptosporangiaceae bacterium]|nr:GH92 family glycosyl hydrolase [Streptosporangiaceae bacterium]